MATTGTGGPIPLLARGLVAQEPVADLALDLVPEALGQVFDVVDRQLTFRPFGGQPVSQPLGDLADAAFPLFRGHGSPPGGAVGHQRSSRPTPEVNHVAPPRVTLPDNHTRMRIGSWIGHHGRKEERDYGHPEHDTR